MVDNEPFSEEELKQIAKRKVIFRLGLQIHIGVFFAVNAFLAILNYIGVQSLPTCTPPGCIWFVYPLAGWIIGLAVHATVYTLYTKGISGDQKWGLAIHAVVWVTGSIALFVINFFSGMGYWWFMWPVGFWPIAVAIHGIVYKKFGPKDLTDRKSTRLNSSHYS